VATTTGPQPANADRWTTSLSAGSALAGVLTGPTCGGRLRQRMSGLGRHELTLLAALVAVNGANLLFHALSSRIMGAASYGALGALLAVLLAITVPATALQIAATAEVARRHSRGEGVDTRALTRRLIIIGVGLMVSCMVLSRPMAAYLHLETTSGVLWLGVYLLPLVVAMPAHSQLMGQRRFGWVALAVLTASATRVGLGLPLTERFGVPGAMAATAFGEVVLATLLHAAAHRHASGGQPLRLPLRDVSRSAAAFGGLWIMLGADTVLARHYLPPEAAGQYAAAVVAARASLFLPQAVCQVALPRFAAQSSAEARAALRQAVALSAAVGLGATVALVLSSSWVLPLVFGTEVAPSRTLFIVSGLSSCGIGVLIAMLQYHVARRSVLAGVPWLGVALLASGAAVWHGHALAIALVVLASVLLSLVLASVDGALFHRTTNPRPGMTLTSATEVDLTVVVPYYNPGDRLRPNLERLLATLRQENVTYEVIAVADGCTDHSAASIETVHGPVRRIVLARNRGKGAALRAGLQYGRGRYLGFIDSDGDLDPKLWRTFLALLHLYRPDAIVGSKRHPLSEIDAHLARRWCSRGFQALARLLFWLPVRDTQVGIKVFRRELLADVLPLTVERGFVFDLEVLVIAKRLGYRRLMEAPVILCGRVESTIRTRTILTMAADTLRLAWRTHVLRSYDMAAERLPAPIASGRPEPDLPSQRTPEESARLDHRLQPSPMLREVS
jgi:O-antigen/teichoic acid export membrane protein